MPRIIFSPFEKAIETDGSKSILQLAQEAGIPCNQPVAAKKYVASARSS